MQRSWRSMYCVYTHSYMSMLLRLYVPSWTDVKQHMTCSLVVGRRQIQWMLNTVVLLYGSFTINIPTAGLWVGGVKRRAWVYSVLQQHTVLTEIYIIQATDKLTILNFIIITKSFLKQEGKIKDCQIYCTVHRFFIQRSRSFKLIMIYVVFNLSFIFWTTNNE